MVGKNIKQVRAGKFRHTVNSQDVILRDEVLQVPVTNNNITAIEEVALFHGIPFQFPSIGRFYRDRLTKNNTKNLLEIVKRLQYINGNLTEEGVKSMVSFIVGNLTARIYSTKEPSIKYEKMHPMVVECMDKPNIKLSMEHRSVLFSYNSRMTREQKWKFTYESNKAAMNKHLGKAVHFAAMNAIHMTHNLLKVTDPRVLERLSTEAINTVRTMKKHMTSETVEALKSANLNRPLNQYKVLEKFTKFLETPNESTTELAASLNTSRSTIVKFKELNNKVEDPREIYELS